jgi:FMNH2-dependent dimethyl sulfone monooxygenase
MQFGLYAPLPHVTVGSKEIEQSIAGAMSPLPAGAVDPAYQLAKDVLCAADKSGFDIILFAERHLGADLEAWILGSAISALTQNLRAMIAVHPGLWHPELIAKMSSTLDRLAPGRMAINLITGWNIEEHRMYGGDALPQSDDRYVRAEEFVDVLRGMWTQTPFSYEGRFFQVDKAQLLLKPATPQPPDIYTASRSDRGLDMVAKVADWWFLDFDKEAADTEAVMESLRRSIATMRERASCLGRTVRFGFNPFLACGKSDEAAMERAIGLLKTDGPNVDMRKIMQRIGPAMKAGCVGRPEKVRDQLLRYQDMGVELFLLKFVPSLDEIGMIRDEIIQPLRAH